MGVLGAIRFSVKAIIQPDPTGGSFSFYIANEAMKLYHSFVCLWHILHDLIQCNANDESVAFFRKSIVCVAFVKL